MKRKKTNAMRMLERADVEFEVNYYEVEDAHQDGETIAHSLGEDPEHVFKTLVLENANHEHYVFVIPVTETLDLKAAAKAVHEKKLNLMPMRDLKQVTGYIRGGCSPVGMKRLFPTTLDETATLLSYIYISGGERGTQIKVAPQDLITVVEGHYADITQSVI